MKLILRFVRLLDSILRSVSRSDSLVCYLTPSFSELQLQFSKISSAPLRKWTEWSRFSAPLRHPGADQQLILSGRDPETLLSRPGSRANLDLALAPLRILEISSSSGK